MKEACAGPLAEAKIAFFCSVASALEPFLWRFQTDAPMAPVLYRELFNVLVFMKRFIKRDLMDKATTPQQLSKLDVNSKESLKEPKDIDVGTEAESFLYKAGVSANEKLVFPKECRNFLVATVAKIFEKSSTSSDNACSMIYHDLPSYHDQCTINLKKEAGNISSNFI